MSCVKSRSKISLNKQFNNAEQISSRFPSCIAVQSRVSPFHCIIVRGCSSHYNLHADVIIGNVQNAPCTWVIIELAYYVIVLGYQKALAQYSSY